MKRFLRLGLVLFSLGAMVVGVAYADPGLAETMGLDFWNFNRFDRELHESRRIHSQLEAAQEQVLWRLTHRSAVVDDLFAGHIDLPHAIRQFEELNRSTPGGLAVLQCQFHTDDEREIAARQLKLYLRGRRVENPDYDTRIEEVDLYILREFAAR